MRHCEERSNLRFIERIRKVEVLIYNGGCLEFKD